MHKKFGKVYPGFWSGTIRNERPTVRLVFMFLCCNCDEDGFITGTDEFFAGFVNVTLAAFVAAVDTLSQPDANSTTPDEDGRRVMRVGPNRLFVVNHQKYYDEGRGGVKSVALTPAERQQRRRDRLREEQQKGSDAASRHVTTKERKEKGKEIPSLVRCAHEAIADEFLALYPKPLPREGSRRPRDIKLAGGRIKLLALLKAGEDGEAILAGVAGFREFIMGNYTKEGPYVPATVPWLNNRLWEEYGASVDASPAAQAIVRREDVPEPKEGVDYEYREVPHLYRSRNEWGVASFAFKVGSEARFDRAEWLLSLGGLP